MELIIYGSQYGTARQYAEELAKRTGFPLKSFEDVRTLEGTDTIIYIGALYAGSVLGMKQTLRLLKNPDHKRIILASAGLGDPKDPQYRETVRAGMKKQMSEEIYRRADIVHLRGAVDYSKLSMKHRLILTALYKASVKLPQQKHTAEVKAIIETFQKTVSFVDFSALDQIMNLLNTEKSEELCLKRPGPEYEEQVMAMKQEILESDDKEPFAGCAGLEDSQTYGDWIDFEVRLKKKYGEGYVPSDVFLAVRKADNQVVGIIDYRHPLNDFLLAYGGNIGYSIRPGERGRGNGKKMLGLVLDYCRSCGEDRVLITCDRENAVSRRTITDNGGVLENEVEDTPGLGHSGVLQRYWIYLGDRI